MSWAAVIIGGAAVVGSVVSSQGAKSAASTAAQGADAAAAESGRQFDITQANTAPYRAIGQQAINRLGSIYGYSPSSAPGTAAGSSTSPTGAPGMSGGGFVNNFGVSVPSGFTGVPGSVQGGDPSSGFRINPSGSVNTMIAAPSTSAAPGAPTANPGAPDYSSFFTSPDYNFRKTQGMQGIENSFSATGGAKSGNALKALADFNSNLASGEFGNYFNRQAALAGIGQTAVGQTAAAGTAAGAQIGNSLIQGADARASGVAGAYNAFGAGVQGIGQGLGYYMQNRGNYGNGYSVSGGFGQNPSGQTVDPATGADYSAWSDPRLKENVKRVGKTDSGLPIYRYNLKGNAMTQMGVMADEAKKKFPSAVKRDPSGYMKVNYMRVH